MFKKVYLPLLGVVVLLSLLLSGCGCKHEWRDATCDAPRTCTKCNETEGEALTHIWAEATTEAPKTCTLCQKTEGERIITDSRFKTEKCEKIFGTWSGIINVPSFYYNLSKISSGLDFKITLTFHNDGTYDTTVDLANKDAVMGHLQAAYMNALLDEFARQNMNEAQANAAMEAAYGMNVEAYAKKIVEEINFDEIYTYIAEDGVYYVRDIPSGNGGVIQNAWDLYWGPDWDQVSDQRKTMFQIFDTMLRISSYPVRMPVAPYRNPKGLSLNLESP